ncbi:MAG: hypothetical protein GF349_03280 [Candidatus Magasanikbacteria bacterium]|nr:hypothetical protein [Candidatus Magasanikbacteria bacterium]
MWVLVLQRMVAEILLDLLYFPIWWYSGGLKNAYYFCKNIFQTANSYLAPSLWLKNIAVPMFGQYDWQGRLVSLFMRIINIIGRSIALFFVLIFVLFLFLLWPTMPIIVFMLFFISLFGLQIS